MTKAAARDVVRVLVRLAETHHRGEADVGALEQLAPLVAGAGAEGRGQPVAYLAASGCGRTGPELVRVDPERVQQLAVEVRLDGRSGHVLPSEVS